MSLVLTLPSNNPAEGSPFLLALLRGVEAITLLLFFFFFSQRLSIFSFQVNLTDALQLACVSE